MVVTEQPPLQQLPPKPHRVWLVASLVLVIGVLLAVIIWWVFKTITPAPTTVIVPTRSAEKPSITAQTILSGYSNIWDIAFLPSQELLFTERKGALHIMQNGTPRKITDISDVFAQGEGGLMGIEVDPAFGENRFIYTCYNSTKNDVRVVRWTLNADATALGDRKDVVTGIPTIAGGRHLGCRAKFGPDGYLYIGTGDAAQSNSAMDHKNLGGKVLRVDRDGNPAPGNMEGDFDPRIFSYGHRNVQGIAFFDAVQGGAIGISIEHGSTVDDEVNLLIKGNFGWAHPPGAYTETNVPMTNKAAYPDAIDAIWSSGSPTIAPSGATFLSGQQWKAWDGALAMAILKDKHLKILTINEQNQVINTEDLFTQQFGRLRTAAQGPDGNLYICTDNGSNNDQIIRVTPQ